MRSRNSLLCERLANLRKKIDNNIPLSSKEIATVRSQNGKCLMAISMIVYEHLSLDEAIAWYRPLNQK